MLMYCVILHHCHIDRNVRRILVRGANPPLPPEAKKILRI